MSIFVGTKLKKAFVGTTKAKKIFLGSTKVWVATVQIDVPTVSGSYTYNGTSQTVSWSGYDSTKMSIAGTLSATDAGTYTATFTPLEGYSWDAEGDDVAPRSVTWTIAQKSISSATVTLSATSKTYTGSSQSVSVTSVAVDGLSATFATSGTTSATTIGTYTVTVTGNGNFTGTASATWAMNVLKLTVPTLSNTSKTYSGSAQSPTISNYNSTYENQSGTSSATAKGIYAVMWTLKDTTNTQWSDGTTTSKSAAWVIEAYNLSNATIASISAYTYTGSAIKPTPSVTALSRTLTSGTDYTWSYSNNTNAGTATATITGAGNYTGTKSATFTINKAAGSVTLSSYSGTIYGVGSTATFTVTRSGNGTISVSSSATAYATASISGTTVTVTCVSTGSATITVSVAAGTNHNAVSTTYAATCNGLPTGCLAEYLFNNNGNDTSGNGNNLTIARISYNTTVFPNHTMAYFDGGSVKPAYASSPIIPTGGNPFSISFWGYYSGSNNRFAISTRKSGNGVSINLHASNKFDVCINPALDTLEQSCNTTSLAHYVVTWGGNSGSVNIYRNNSLFSTRTASGTLTGHETNLVIGGQTVYAWSGYIGLIRIYNKVLSATEISTLYNSGNGI